MQVFELQPHPGDRPPRIAIIAEAARTIDGAFVLHFSLTGAVDTVVLPAAARYAVRTNDLWQTTCFEAFVATKGSQSYTEFNVAPSTAWAVYRFENYRAGMSSPNVLAIRPDIDRSADAIELWATIDVTEDPILSAPEGWSMGLCAVIEATDGTKSHWALAHAPGAPDFHNRDCFIATLPAPTAP